MSSNGDPERLDVAVVGAGQAGLAIGYFLARQGCRFAIFDGADVVGAAWRDRWDSLVLFTPRHYDSLPGMRFEGEPDGYPMRDEVIAYLESYARTFELPVELGSTVRSLTKGGEAFVLTFDGRSVEADQVVVATGPFQTQRVPAWARDLAPEVVQIDSAGYRASSDVPTGTVLVVGGGNTGFQITTELAATHDVHLSIGSRQAALPQRLLGRDLFSWLVAMRLMDKTVDSRIGQRMRTRETLVGQSRRGVRRLGVELKRRAVGASGRTVRFADGTELAVDAVIWATGFRLDHSWIKLPITTEEGELRHRRGVTDIPGLYFLGMPWQYTRGSALLGWVKDDAEYIARQIATHRPTE